MNCWIRFVLLLTALNTGLMSCSTK